MKWLFRIVIVFSVETAYAQFKDNGIGGYGFVEYDIMHNTKMQGNWAYGGGGLIVNKVFFGGLYFGSQTKAFSNVDYENQELIIGLNKPDSLGALFNLTLSDVGIQLGGVVWAEKPIQLIISSRTGLFLSNLNETVPFTTTRNPSTTRPYFTFTPEFKLSFMPIRIMKTQLGVGYKYVSYSDSRIQEEGTIGHRNNMFNSFYWSLSLVFGSFY